MCILDAVPGFVLELKKLETLHRHGNQNYFRTTFMWYVCEGRERIRTASFSGEFKIRTHCCYDPLLISECYNLYLDIFETLSHSSLVNTFC